MRKLLRLGLLALFITVPLLGSKTIAAPKPAITISPFLREVRVLSSDATKDFDVSVTNNSSIIQNFKLSVLDFGSLNDTGGVVFAGSNANKLIKKYGLSNWLQLSANEIQVDPGKTVLVTATIINDVTLQPGGHYAAIIAALDNPDPSLMNEISINQRLSSLILATKVGGERYDLKLEKIEAKGSLFRLPKTVVLHFYNPGNVHVVPRGTIKIVSPSGKVIARGVINDDSSFVLPETTRQMIVDLKPMGINSLWPTRYKVQVDYRYDGLEQFAVKNQTLYFINVPGIIALVITGFTIGWVIWRLRTQLKNLYKIIRKKLSRKPLK